MRNAEYYVAMGTLEEARAEIHKDVIDDIREVLERLDEYELVELLHDVNPDFHTMDELDDVFDYMSVTEILEELGDIDLSDDYFNESTRTSGCDAWYVADEDIDDIARQFYDSDHEGMIDEIDDILYLENALISDVTNKFKIYDKAKELFEEGMARNPQEVLNLLWNMNM